MERSFKKEVEALKLGDGETFRGEGILAVTKALLQSGVAYVGGYQGAPVSHLLDVLVQSEDLLSDLGFIAPRADQAHEYLYRRLNGGHPAVPDLVSYDPVGDGSPATCKPTTTTCGSS